MDDHKQLNTRSTIGFGTVKGHSVTIDSMQTLLIQYPNQQFLQLLARFFYLTSDPEKPNIFVKDFPIIFY
jgi:hypothetical protein